MISNQAGIRNKVLSIIFFTVWPAVTLFFAFKNYKASWSKNILWLFVVFYGYTIVISNDKMDANRYRDQFLEMVYSDISAENFADLLYDQESKFVDVLQPLLSFVVSRFSDDYHILFAVFGIIYGYFYSRNLWFLLERTGSKIKLINIPVFVTFALVVAIWNMNGFRFWTATLMFFFGTIHFLIDGKKKYLWILLLSVFVHFAYIFPVIILSAYIILGNRRSLYFVFFVITLFMSEINFGQLNAILSSFLPSVLQERVSSYTSEEYAQILQESHGTKVWYAQFYNLALKWSVVSFVVIIFIKGKYFLSKNQQLQNLFNFGLLLYACANLASLIPSGGRFISLGNLFFLTLIFWYIQFAPSEKFMRRLVVFTVPALCLYCLISLRFGLYTLSFFTFLGNPFIAIFSDMNFALDDMYR